MRPGVVADQMPSLVGPAYQIPLLDGKLADQEERSPHVEPRQQVEQLRSPARVRPVVEGQGNLLRVGWRDQTAAEELRGRPQTLQKIARCS